MKKMKCYELKSLICRKVYTESCIHRYSSNTVRFMKSNIFFIKKLRKVSFKAYMNGNGKDII